MITVTHITSTSRTLNSFYLNAVLKSVSFSGLWAASRIHAFGTSHDRSNRWDPPPHLTPAFLVSRLYAPSPVCRCCTTLASASQPLLPIMCPLAINVLHSCFVSFFFSFYFAREGAVVVGWGRGTWPQWCNCCIFVTVKLKRHDE